MTTEIVLRNGEVAKMDQIRDYFDYLAQAEESGDHYPVDLEVVWKFAYSTRGNAKKALVKSDEFFEGEDYHIIQLDNVVKRPQGGGTQLEKIVMTAKCFEFFVARKERPIFEVYRQCRIAVSKIVAAQPKAVLPYHIRRYLANQEQVPIGYFSILQEVIMKLVAPLEMHGHSIKDNMLPDGSVGKTFCRALRDAGHDPDSFPSYNHHFEDGRVVQPRAYPIKLLPTFIEHFQKEWMVKRAVPYFEKRDEEALPHLAKIIEGPRIRPQIDA